MNTKCNDTLWQKEFLEMKFHSPADVKLLTQGVKGLKGAWHLGVLKQEYNRLKKMQEQQKRITYKLSRSTSILNAFKR